MINNGVKVSGYIRPIGKQDSYATHLDNFGRGGIHSVANQAARDEITTERRSIGMLAYDYETNNMYSLLGGVENSNWQKLFEYRDNAINFNGNLLCNQDYIFVGNRDNVAKPSPALIDIRLDLIGLNRDIAQIQYDRILPTGKLWMGDSSNKAVATTNIGVNNLPQIGVAQFPEPTGLLSIPLPNPTFNPLSGLDWLMSGAWLPQIFAGSPGRIDPTVKNTVLSSSLAMTQIKTAQAIKRLDNTGFIVQKREVTFDWENPAMLAIPQSVKDFYDLNNSYTFTNAQALDEIGAGLLYNSSEGNLSKASLTNNHIWLGQSVGEDDNIPVEVEHLPSGNLPNLTKGSIWQGDENNRPIEIEYKAAPDDATYILQKPNPSLQNAQSLNTLSGGLLKTTVLSNGKISIASGGKVPVINDYVRPVDLVEEVEILQSEVSALASVTTGLASDLTATQVVTALGGLLSFSITNVITGLSNTNAKNYTDRVFKEKQPLLTFNKYNETEDYNNIGVGNIWYDYNQNHIFQQDVPKSRPGVRVCAWDSSWFAENLFASPYSPLSTGLFGYKWENNIFSPNIRQQRGYVWEVDFENTKSHANYRFPKKFSLRQVGHDQGEEGWNVEDHELMSYDKYTEKFNYKKPIEIEDYVIMNSKDKHSIPTESGSVFIERVTVN